MQLLHLPSIACRAEPCYVGTPQALVFVAPLCRINTRSDHPITHKKHDQTTNPLEQPAPCLPRKQMSIRAHAIAFSHSSCTLALRTQAARWLFALKLRAGSSLSHLRAYLLSTGNARNAKTPATPAQIWGKSHLSSSCREILSDGHKEEASPMSLLLILLS